MEISDFWFNIYFINENVVFTYKFNNEVTIYLDDQNIQNQDL